MKKTVFLMLCASLCISFMATSCDKKDEKTETDDWQYVKYWDLQSINGEVVPQKQFTGNLPYVFKIVNDTTFYLSTSVNKAGGNYYKSNGNKILIKNYQEYTEVYNENEKEREFDELLLKSLNNTFTYSFENEIIVLQKDTITIIFSPREFIPSELHNKSN